MPSLPLSNNPAPLAQTGDFLRLGLRRGESCAAVIREAALDSVRRLLSSIDEWNEGDDRMVDRQVGLLAASAYRLLDPRCRTQLYERIQLSYLLERDEQHWTYAATNDLWTIPKTSLEPFARSNKTEGDEHDSRAKESGLLNEAREIVRYLQRLEVDKPDAKMRLATRLRNTLRNWLSKRAS
jgi:hypothetical protein